VQEQCRACQVHFRKKQTTQFSRHERRLAGGCSTQNQMDALVPSSTCCSGLGLCCQLVWTTSPSEVPKRSSDRTTMDSSPPTFTAGMIVPMWSSGEDRAQMKSFLSFTQLEHTPVATILHRPGLLAHKRRQLQLGVFRPGSDQNHGADIEVLLLSYFMNSGLNLHAQRANLYCLILSLSRRTIVLRSTRKCLIIYIFNKTFTSPYLGRLLTSPYTGCLPYCSQ
jgi:hypothetical protein